MSHIVIIGTGQAGTSVARELRKLNPEAQISLISQDDAVTYYKPNLSKAYASGKDAESLIMASPEAQDALWLSVRTCVIATVVDVFLGVPIALLLARDWNGVAAVRVFMRLALLYTTHIREHRIRSIINDRR